MDFLLLRRIEQRLFAEDDALPGWRRRLLWSTRLLYVMLRDIFYGPLPLHATSLVYTTLLSLVPLMALGVAVIKLFGLPDQLLPLLHGFLQPLGERGETVNRTVIDFIERIDIAPLGSIGLILLVYVAVTLIYKVERSLNLIWRVRRHRTFLQLIGHCLLLVLLGPLLLVVLMGAIAVVMNSTLMHHLLALGAVSSLLLQLSWLLPVLLAALMIGAVYLLVPNTSVRLSAAFTGSTVASLLWQLCGRIFSGFLISSAHYEAIYSGFAVLILLLLWLFWSWLILLLGAAVAFYLQNPAQMKSERNELWVGGSLTRLLGLSIMHQLACSAQRKEGVTLASLSERLQTPIWSVSAVVDLLGVAGLLTRQATAPEACRLACEPAQIELAALLRLLDEGGEPSATPTVPLPAAVEQLHQRLMQAEQGAVGRMTLAELAATAEGQTCP